MTASQDGQSSSVSDRGVLPAGEVARLEGLAEILRSMVASSRLIPPGPKLQLTGAIYRLQSELKNPTIDVDQVGSIIVTIGTQLGRLGQPVEPMVRCARDMFQTLNAAAAGPENRGS